LELIYDCAPSVPARLQGDVGRLRQILTNLLGNALKFTPKGEVALRVSLAEEEPGACILAFTVSDTGVGIPPTHLETIFDKFSQVDVSTTRKFGGTGLGLPISKHLAELMGGGISVISREGGGSQFRATVRLGHSGQATPRAQEVQPLGCLRGAHVLVVDDSATQREVLREQMTLCGMSVKEADSGSSALATLYQALEESIRFDIVVIDMDMQGMDGEAVGRTIRSDERLADTPIIMLTTLLSPYDAQHARQIGFASCVDKPIRRDELLHELCAALLPVKGSLPDSTTVTARRENERQRPLPFVNARVLVAEDNFTNQIVAIGTLKKLGIRADAVGNGAEAVKSLETTPYDLVLMDMRMPELDGIEATRRIRNPQSTVLNHYIPIIAMTASTQPSDRDRCFQAGMNGFITKPVLLSELRKVLEHWLSPECQNVQS